jgi:hypothetical protein
MVGTEQTIRSAALYHSEKGRLPKASAGLDAYCGALVTKQIRFWPQLDSLIPSTWFTITVEVASWSGNMNQWLNCKADRKFPMRQLSPAPSERLVLIQDRAKPAIEWPCGRS